MIEQIEANIKYLRETAKLQELVVDWLKKLPIKDIKHQWVNCQNTVLSFRINGYKNKTIWLFVKITFSRTRNSLQSIFITHMGLEHPYEKDRRKYTNPEEAAQYIQTILDGVA